MLAPLQAAQKPQQVGQLVLPHRILAVRVAVGGEDFCELFGPAVVEE